MPKINDSLFSFLVSFRKFWIPFDCELSSSVGSQRRTGHLPVKHLEFRIALYVFGKFERGWRSACLTANGYLPFLDFNPGQSHSIWRQQAGNLIKQLDGIKLGIHCRLDLSPSFRGFLDGRNRRSLLSNALVKAGGNMFLPIQVSGEGGNTEAIERSE